ncbi:MAG: anthranilate synthase component I family protein, partial [Tepidiformaceae bacterium]
MLTPTMEEVREIAKRGEGNVVPVYREVIADMETPVSAYLKVARGEYSFLLESVEGGERLARFSFIGTQPYRVLRTGDNAEAGEIPGDPLVLIEEELKRFRPVKVPGLPRLTGGAVGYMAYEVARYYERLPMPEADPQGFPESIFLFTDTLLVFDHIQHAIKVVSHVRLDGDIEASYKQAAFRIDELVERLGQPLLRLPYEVKVPRSGNSRFESNNTKEDFMQKVMAAKEYIQAGDTYQIQISQRFSRKTDAHPFEVYRALRTVNPSPYMYYLELGDLHVAGASPEMVVRIEDGVIETHPIAGTRRRGRDETDELRMAAELQESEKERAEHIMLVDLARNDLGRVCRPGTVEVTALMEIERYSHVMHMVSHVVGVLRPDVSVYDALRAYFPHGTVTGA